MNVHDPPKKPRGCLSWRRRLVVVSLVGMVGLGMCENVYILSYFLSGGEDVNVNINLDAPGTGGGGFGPGIKTVAVDPASTMANHSRPHDAAVLAEVQQCTREQKDVIKKQLPPDDCLRNRKTPYNQRCSHTYATRCPDATWFEEHYADLHKKRIRNMNREDTNADAPPFVGIFVGCNKGMDAVNAMRMGSGDPTFDLSKWKHAMTKGGKIRLGNSVCGQDDAGKQFRLPNSENTTSSVAVDANVTNATSASRYRLFCVEPMPSTARALARSARQLGWDGRGFLATHAAIAKTDGVVRFPDLSGVGVENKGMGNCKQGGSNDGCVDVPMLSLDSFVHKFLTPGAVGGGKGRIDSGARKGMDEVPVIDYLSVDVEGYDYDVLLGGLTSALPRVRYLEFEYNWMGSWSKQSLKEAVSRLDHLGFTCYWPGFDGHIWRITKCWLNHYDVHFWSNVACVNRKFAEMDGVAKRMEGMFLDTIAKGEEVVMTFENRYKNTRH